MLTMDRTLSRQIAIAQIPGLACSERLMLESVLPPDRLAKRVIEAVIRRPLAGVSSALLRRCCSAPEQAQKRGLAAVHIHHSCYPKLLREIYEPPYMLFSGASLPVISRLLCVVGTVAPGKREASAVQALADQARAADILMTVPVMPGVPALIMDQGAAVMAAASSAGAAPKRVLSVSEHLESPSGQNRLLDFIRIAPGMAPALCVIGAVDTAASSAAVEFALEEGREVCLFRPPGRLAGQVKRLAEDGASVLSSIQDLYSPVRQPQN